jgi:ankyrin repeat protein
MNNTDLLGPPPEWDLLLSAAQKNNADKIQALVQNQGVDPSHANRVGQSALHIAALWGHGAFLLLRKKVIVLACCGVTVSS